MESLTPDEYQQYQNILNSRDKCIYDYCMKALKKVISSTDAMYYCLVLCIK